MKWTEQSQGPGFTLRFATEGDCAVLLGLIQELAVYEKMEDQVVATEESLRDSLFRQKKAEVLLGEFNGKPVAFTLFFSNYSTFWGKANLYIEDVYVQEAFRGRGFGREIFRKVAEIAAARGCERIDWSCLNWNTSAMGFYESLGAAPMSEWTTFRMTGGEIRALAAEAKA